MWRKPAKATGKKRRGPGPVCSIRWQREASISRQVTTGGAMEKERAWGGVRTPDSPKAEGRSPKAGVRSPKSEVRSPKSEVRSPKFEKAEFRVPNSEGKKPRRGGLFVADDYKILWSNPGGVACATVAAREDRSDQVRSGRPVVVRSRCARAKGKGKMRS
jgi:hypothetical protein